MRQIAVKKIFQKQRICTYQCIRYPIGRILAIGNSAFRALLSFVKMLLSWLFNVNVDAFFEKQPHAALDELLAWQPAEIESRSKHLKHSFAPKKMAPKKGRDDTSSQQLNHMSFALRVYVSLDKTHDKTFKFRLGPNTKPWNAPRRTSGGTAYGFHYAALKPRDG